MNNINPIFEALGDVNERHVPVNEKKRPGKKMKIALIAVISAAALAMIVGAAARANSTFFFGYNDEYDHGFTLDIYANEYTVPEECQPEPGKEFFVGRLDMTASELVKKFGLPMLMSDDVGDIEAKTDKQKPWVSFATNAPGGCNHIDFEYYLHDNITDRNIHFYAHYHSDPDAVGHLSSTTLNDDIIYEIVRLNNGSLCLATEWGAHFCYYGAEFSITLPNDRPEGYYDWTFDEQAAWGSEQPAPGIDTVKQVLADLGVYDPE